MRLRVMRIISKLIEASEEVHNETELKAAVAAHYQCSACDKYFDAEKKETTLERDF